MEYRQIDKFIVTNKLLGQGSFGSVYFGYLKEDKSQLLAVKTIDFKHLRGDFKALKREMDMLSKLEGPNIVKFYKPIRTEKNIYFFLEYCQKDLKSHLKEKKILSESESLTYFRQVCDGFKVFQQNSAIHRDIKPANIMLHKGIAKITDFGFARIVDDVEAQVAHTFVGSPLYMSPQMLAREKFSSKCDVWSLGFVLFEMLYGRTPWTAKNPAQLLENIGNQKLSFPSTPPRSQAVKRLLQKMLAINEEHRISWNDLFLHELVNNNAKLKSEFDQIKGSELEGLEKSFKMNQFYVKNNKVLGQDHLEIFDSEGYEGKGIECEHAPSSGDIEGDTKYQEMKKQEQAAIEKVDQHIRYRRNVYIFVNITTNNFYSQAKGRIPESLFYIGIFILQKYQLNGYSSLIQAFNGKREMTRVHPHEWKLYKTSNDFWATLRALKNDQKYLRPYFKEVLEKSRRYFDKHPVQEEFLSIYHRFKIEHTESVAEFSPDNHQFILDKMVQYMSKKHNLSVKLYDDIRLCMDPFKEFKEDTDFASFYEKEVEEQGEEGKQKTN